MKLSTLLLQAMAWAAINGAGLAFVLPCAQSILADYYIPEQRGRAFGFMFTLAALGESLSPAGSHCCHKHKAAMYTNCRGRLLSKCRRAQCTLLQEQWAEEGPVLAFTACDRQFRP